MLRKVYGRQRLVYVNGELLDIRKENDKKSNGCGGYPLISIEREMEIASKRLKAYDIYVLCIIEYQDIQITITVHGIRKRENQSRSRSQPPILFSSCRSFHSFFLRLVSITLSSFYYCYHYFFHFHHHQET